MRGIEYFSIDNQEYGLSKIKESDWVAVQFLYSLLKDNKFHEYTDKNARVFMLVEGSSLISFCTLSDKDDIDCADLMPWIGFVYTFPQYRGNRYVGELIDYVADLAEKDGYRKIYVSTNIDVKKAISKELTNEKTNFRKKITEVCCGLQTNRLYYNKSKR